MKFTDLVRMVSDVLSDETNVAWTVSQVRDWLVDAELATISVRPDAAALANQTVALGAGVVQSLPSGGFKLLSVQSNLNGQSIRLVERGIKDDYNPSWRTATESGTINEYMYDDRTPEQYLVSPPAVAGTQIVIDYAKVPDTYDFNADPSITIADVYAPAMIEWALYRCFSRSDTNTPDYARGQSHKQSWGSLLNVKVNSDITVSPKQRGHLQ